MAGLLVMATRSNQSAYLRTQVTFLANGIADRMRANPAGVWAGNYNITALPTATQDCSGSSCNAAQLAKHDLGAWAGQLNTFLPAPTATISCDASSAGFTPSTSQVSMNPPYGGSCTMLIQWSERDVGATTNASGSATAVVGNANGLSTQKFQWVFTP
jgi:type IV pilus assembly protein PilV